MYRCDTCKRSFDEVQIIEETHGLDCPPYEKVAVCPYCQSTDFSEFNPMVEKLIVAEKLLEVIAALNRYTSSLKDLYGVQISNDDLENALGTAADFVSELYEFLPAAVDNAIIHTCTEDDAAKILKFLED